MSLLKQDIIKNEQINENVTRLNAGNKDNKEYKVEAIWDNIVYANKSESHLLGLYYLVTWKYYFEEKNT